MEGLGELSALDGEVAAATAAASGPSFAHASEAELARILDFYAVRWNYEPHVFPILWNLEGGVVESFSPDFYLPDFDSYVELTTLRQPLVRKKNRKLRRLRELYPDIKIKLFYARDFRALMLKYGKLGLVDALSGTSGQVMPASARPTDTAGTDPSASDTDAGTDRASDTANPANPSVALTVDLVRPVASRSARARRRRRRAASAAAAAIVPGTDA